MKLKTKNVIASQDWDELVEKTYGRPYCLQQQDGCQGRGNIGITVPSEDNDSDMADSVPEICNAPEMGVKFAKWLERDPKQPLGKDEDCRDEQWAIDLWWNRNFYPDLQTVANDLHSKGLLDAGDHTINIDW